MVYRIFVERRQGFRIQENKLLCDFRDNLLISGITGVRLVNCYLVEGISEEVFNSSVNTIFAEPQTDTVLKTLAVTPGERYFAVEYLPGQFDQRADSCSQCIQILTKGERPTVRTSKIYILSGELSDSELSRIKSYVINPVESREAELTLPETLRLPLGGGGRVSVHDGFITSTDTELAALASKLGLAMDTDDILFCRDYFKNTEHRDPSDTEIRLIDSYWSDHCRHTTFLTSIDSVTSENPYIKAAFESYLEKRAAVYGERKKPITLMDMATLAAKYLKKCGYLRELDVSEEINACSIKISVDVDGKPEDWLLMFKNETHNHPTEIEPFGGAATCLGGAIRDPLSGRSYVYQAMRVTGAADPRLLVSKTLPGKLPQSKLTVGAANGYSSYGNQIGLSTGSVSELYHPGYVAKRLEIGAVVGAAPVSNIVRLEPSPGDIVILLGGRTGRDGCGGATGSSKAHTSESLATCGAEVQKGNPPEERKLQRLFRNPDVTHLIKRCNDFGAGGVSVAIGELADGLVIDLSKVPKKYEGLSGTELAISESQERMAVVVSPENADKFIKYAEGENLEATAVAVVTAEKRLVMTLGGEVIVSLTREFLNSNGAPKHATVSAAGVNTDGLFDGLSKTASCLTDVISDLNVCSQKGLVERFDSSIGAGTVVMPYGGKYQLTAPQFMAAKIPLEHGYTDKASVMAYGFNPYVSQQSPYHGALYAVVDSCARLVCAGLPYGSLYLTFQEYFERTRNKPERWGKPFAALLGAFTAQTELKIAAIGGKDSMSGSFENIDVPPTLVSFAVGTADAGSIITPEFKSAGDRVYLLGYRRNSDLLPDFDDLRRLFDYVHELITDGCVKASYAVGFGGVAEAVIKMSLGNGIGFEFAAGTDEKEIMKQNYGAFVIETDRELNGVLIGHTKAEPVITLNGKDTALSVLEAKWKETLEGVFPTNVKLDAAMPQTVSFDRRPNIKPLVRVPRPRVIIPVFPGTNCEYDTGRSFEMAGAEVDFCVLRNLNPRLLEESIDELARKINASQIFMLPGGFSGGDEPDGSGKFITAVLRNPMIKEVLTSLLEKRDGLMLGICNGFQALVKSGLLPYGKISDELTPDSPTLSFNAIGRHQSMMVNTRIASVHSPWLAGVSVGDIHTIPISHGEGRFIANPALKEALITNGQIATQYVDLSGKPTMDTRFNPNASDLAIEGILSPDGRIFGKMGHSERVGKNVIINVPGEKDQRIFASGVEYFK